MGKVQVERGLLGGLAAVAAVALLAAAFLLGRASRPAPPSSPPMPREAPSASPLPVGLETRGRPEPLSLAAPSVAPTPEGAGLHPPIAIARPAPAARAGPQVDPERAGIASYLDAVDNIQPGRASGDAEGMAGDMAAALAKGDTTGLDGMIRQAEEARRRLASLQVPGPCADHYRECLGSLDDALEMLRSLKRAMESPEPSAGLAAVASKAAGVRSRSDDLQRIEEALRQRYGLPR
jgi:hypothetical protein